MPRTTLVETAFRGTRRYGAQLLSASHCTPKAQSPPRAALLANSDTTLALMVIRLTIPTTTDPAIVKPPTLGASHLAEVAEVSPTNVRDARIRAHWGIGTIRALVSTKEMTQ